MNTPIELSPIEAVYLKSLVEKEMAAKAAVYDAIKTGKICAVYAKKREYENCCINIWSFNIRHGNFPTVRVNIPDTDPC
jgi:hypothetical protein